MTLLDIAFVMAVILLAGAVVQFSRFMADEARKVRKAREHNIQRQITRGQR